jgi:hypothetical protein
MRGWCIGWDSLRAHTVRQGGTHDRPGDSLARPARAARGPLMMDAVSLGLTFGFFVLSYALVVLCERL